MYQKLIHNIDMILILKYIHIEIFIITKNKANDKA
jgi:hypothetical protein